MGMGLPCHRRLLTSVPPHLGCPQSPPRCPCPSQTSHQVPADPTDTGVMLTARDGQETFLAQVF